MGPHQTAFDLKVIFIMEINFIIVATEGQAFIDIIDRQFPIVISFLCNLAIIGLHRRQTGYRFSDIS